MIAFLRRAIAAARPLYFVDYGYGFTANMPRREARRLALRHNGVVLRAPVAS